MSKPPITAKGAQRLREQMEQLKRVDRKRIVNAIAEARAHGDLSENAEYHAAREEQSFVEGRIAMLEELLANAQIIDVAKLNAGRRIVFGAAVELLHLKEKKKVSYQIVGEAEADIEQGRIAVTSPIARALIGRNEGDSVRVEAPGGAVDYEVVRVRYR